MPSVLKFPLEKVRRTTGKKPEESNSIAEILFFTGIRYERTNDDDLNKQAKSEKRKSQA